MTVPEKDCPWSWEALREIFFPALSGREDINANFRQVLDHSVKHGGLRIPDPELSVQSSYSTSKASIRELVDSLIGGSALNYIGHRVCVRKASLAARHTKIHVELGELTRQKDLA